MSSSVHVDNNEKDILILCEGPTQRIRWCYDNTEAKYPIHFIEPWKRSGLSLGYNESNSSFAG